jgi:hypothetical protein
VTRWTDLAVWTPTEAYGESMRQHRGLVLHIAEGYYQGTIAWQRNKANKVSSHFVAGRDQHQLAQLVDTDVQAWTQRAGNEDWLSLECAGFTLGHRLHKTHPGWERLSDWQIQCAALLLVRMHHQYGVPLQLATSPAGRGLGHHSMGGVPWGHLDCPGPPIIAQKPTVLLQARLLSAQPNTEVAMPIDWTNQTVKAINFYFSEAYRAQQNKATLPYPEHRPATPAEVADRAARNAYTFLRNVDGVDPEPTHPSLLVDEAVTP